MNVSDAPASKSSDSSQVAVFSMKEAAQVAGISVSTLRRRRADLEAAGAVIGPDRWQVPITALEAVGLMRSPASTKPSPSTPPAPKETSDLVALREAHKRIQELETENMELRHRAELAEAIARERGEALHAERMALRMIVAAPSSASAQKEENPSHVAQHPSATSTVRPSWWRRKFS